MRRRHCGVARHVVTAGLLLTVTAATLAAQRPDARPVVVASKPFGESYLLCEMFAQLLESRGIAVERRPGLGATEIAFAALRSGAIDVYPEYTGTGLLVVLHDTLADSASHDPRRVFARVARELPSMFRSPVLGAFLGSMLTKAAVLAASPQPVVRRIARERRARKGFIPDSTRAPQDRPRGRRRPLRRP